MLSFKQKKSRMQKWTTIITFNHHHDAHMAKTRLEAEDIEVFMKDELSVQVQTYLSQALGGIKLQVRENQVLKAVHVLKTLGYDMDFKTTNEFWQKIDKATASIPLVSTLAVEIRLMVLIAILLLILAIPIYLLLMPSAL